MKPTKWIPLCILGITLLTIFKEARTTCLILSIVLGVIVLIDTLGLLLVKGITCQREISTSLAILRSSPISVMVRHESSRTFRMIIQDRCPLELNPINSRTSVVLPPEKNLKFHYRIEPPQRGEFEFKFVDISCTSLLGFWARVFHIPCQSSVRVYPDFSQITHYLKMLLAHQTMMLGMRKQQRRGTGLDFHQLREYRQGDQLNHIDWKATSKRRTLISREFQDERAQNLFFLVDTGKRMHSDDEDTTLFDQALNAMLLLSYIALRHGDRVSVQFFGQTNRWIPEMIGLSSVNRLLQQTYDLQTGTYASDYIAVAEEALVRQRKRSLVILLTSFRDRDQDLPAALKILSTRHMVLLGNLHESVIDFIYDSLVTNVEEAVRVLGTAKYIDDRARVATSCKNCCRMVVETKPMDLPVAMVNAYWELKRAGQV